MLQTRSSTPASGDGGSIATTGALGALLATVTVADSTAVPEFVPSEGTTPTRTVSPRLNQLAPLRLDDVAEMADPLTYQA